MEGLSGFLFGGGGALRRGPELFSAVFLFEQPVYKNEINSKVKSVQRMKHPRKEGVGVKSEIAAVVAGRRQPQQIHHWPNMLKLTTVPSCIPPAAWNMNQRAEYQPEFGPTLVMGRTEPSAKQNCTMPV